jgi:hypothetical protein
MKEMKKLFHVRKSMVEGSLVFEKKERVPMRRVKKVL